MPLKFWFDFCIFIAVREQIQAESAVQSHTAMETSSEPQPPSPTYTKPPIQPWPSFEQEVNELQDWLILLQHVRKAQIVTVGDIVEIEETIIKQKVKK